MGRKPKGSALEQLFTQFWDITEYFWPVVAVITVMLLCSAAASAVWVIDFEQGLSDNPINQIFQNLSWLFYSLPLIILGIAFLFGRWTFYSYLKQNGQR